MYQAFHYNLYKNNLREAEAQRKQHELSQIAQERASNRNIEQREGFLMRLFSSRTQAKQAATSVRRAPAQ